MSRNTVLHAFSSAAPSTPPTRKETRQLQIHISGFRSTSRFRPGCEREGFAAQFKMEANRRRRSVAFAVAENPRSARSSRRSAAEETTDVAAAAPATGVRKEAPASAQAAPSWVKKRRKVDTTAGAAGAAGAGQAGVPSSAAASAADISTPAPAASRDHSALADTVRIAAAVANAVSDAALNDYDQTPAHTTDASW